MNNSLIVNVHCVLLLLTLLNSFSLSASYVYTRNATQRAIGTIIPWPRNITFVENEYLGINVTNFVFSIEDEINTCLVVKKAVDRYTRLYLFDDVKPNLGDSRSTEMKRVGSLTSLHITRLPGSTFSCESMPTENMLEDYHLNLKAKPAVLSAKTSWGIIRGLETFSQLIFNVQSPDLFGIRQAVIRDGPRFKFRGYMLDTARHYISIDKIYNLLDAMAFNKLNVFHWHLVDDQSFPFVSHTFPEISQKASFRPNMIYSQEVVKSVINYAAERGIRVIPELDSPGHTYSMRHLDGFLTKCYNTSTGKPNGDLGPVDPTNINSYKIMLKLIREFKSVFPDSYFHAGGDEVDYDCWKSNPQITEWMNARNMTGNYKELANYYIRRIYDFLTHYNQTMLVWQEVFDEGATLPKDAIVHVWKFRNDRPAYMSEVRTVINAGYRAILSSCWYLNIIDYGQDWVKFYQCEPAYEITRSENLILGGEICMWSEFVDDSNVISRTWPRASAAAERLWSPRYRISINDFLYRLEQMRCRLLSRGIQAEPVNGPGYC